jgi:hypothetical protein
VARANWKPWEEPEAAEPWTIHIRLEPLEEPANGEPGETGESEA